MKQTAQYGIKSIIVLAFVMLNTSVTPAVEAPRNEHKSKPNVIVVITDDQGWGDLGCRGNPFIKTPNLDKLHDEAVRFTNFHVSTTCAPSRGSLMTGRHCNRLNVFHTIMGRSLLFEDELLLPEVVAYNGYVKLPKEEADLSAFIDHIDHAVEVMGIDHVGIGADFDGDPRQGRLVVDGSGM